MRGEENESEEGVVEDDYGSNEIDGFGQIGGFGKREEMAGKEKRTQMREREREGVNIWEKKVGK